MDLSPAAGTSLAAILATDPVRMDIPLGGELLSGPMQMEPARLEQRPLPPSPCPR